MSGSDGRPRTRRALTLALALICMGLPWPLRAAEPSECEKPAPKFLVDVACCDPPVESLAGKTPVLFVHGHSGGNATVSYQRSWWESPSFKTAIEKNSHLGLVPYYVDFDVLDQEEGEYKARPETIGKDAADLGTAIECIRSIHEQSAGAVSTRRPKVVLVGHSKGTITSRLYLKRNVGSSGVSEFIAIAPPNHGGAWWSANYRAVEQLTNGHAAPCAASTRQCKDGDDFADCRFGEPADCPPADGQCCPSLCETCPEEAPPCCPPADGSCCPPGCEECPEQAEACCPEFTGCDWDEAAHFMECLNGHSICDTWGARGTTIEQHDDYSAEAPGSRGPADSMDKGVLYVVLGADNNADSLVGGETTSGDCLGRKMSKNLAPDAVNRWVNVGTLGVHTGIVHHHRVICMALYTAATHRPPADNLVCETDGSGLPILPQKVDVVQVLDRSGSMARGARAEDQESKMEALKKAATAFAELMTPAIPEDPEDPRTGNRLGLVQFNQDPVDFDADLDTGLAELTRERFANLKKAIAGIKTGGDTSIGDGLAAAHDQFDEQPDGRTRRILLVTDGKENRDQRIANVLKLRQKRDIVVDVVGLGHGQGVDETRLTSLAEATSGKLWLTTDTLELPKFFLETLAGVEGWSLALDPFHRLAPGETLRQSVTVGADEQGLTVVAFWEGIDDAVGLELVPPGAEDPIDPDAQGPGSRRGGGDRYAFVQLAFPLPGDWVGDWTLVARASTEIEDEDGVRLGLSAFVEGGADIQADLGRLLYAAGEEVTLGVRLSRGGDPLAGASLRAECDLPAVGLGNALHAFRARLRQLVAGSRTGSPPAAAPPPGDAADRLDRKLELLLDRLGQQTRETVPVNLLDDGRPPDGATGDGVYTGVLGRTRVPGRYSCRVLASAVPLPGGGTTTREWSGSLRVEAAVEPQHSTIEARLLDSRRGARRYWLRVVPRDRFFNYLGPGYPVVVSVPGPERPRVQLTDERVRGIYVGEVSVSESRPGARFEVVIGDRPFASLEPPALRRWSLGLGGGIAAPQGDLSRAFDAGGSLALSGGRAFTPRLELVGRLGYHTLTATAAGLDDTYWTELSAGLEYVLRPGRTRPVLGGGLGVYLPETGGGSLGAYLAIGVEHDLTATLALTAGVEAHSLFDEEGELLVQRVGVVFRL